MEITTKAKHKADLVYATGNACVEEELAPLVMKALESYDGVYYDDIRMNGLVLIEKKH